MAAVSVVASLVIFFPHTVICWNFITSHFTTADKLANEVSIGLCNMCGQQAPIIYLLFPPLGSIRDDQKQVEDAEWLWICDILYTCANADKHTPAVLADNQGWSVITSRCESCGGFRLARAIYYMRELSQHAKDRERGGEEVVKRTRTFLLSSVVVRQICSFQLQHKGLGRTFAGVATCCPLRVFCWFFLPRAVLFKGTRAHFGNNVQHVALCQRTPSG